MKLWKDAKIVRRGSSQESNPLTEAIASKQAAADAKAEKKSKKKKKCQEQNNQTGKAQDG